MNDARKHNLVKVLKDFLTENYRYERHYDHDRNIRDLVKMKYLHGRSTRSDGIYVYGFFNVTELGKTWLEFNEL